MKKEKYDLIFSCGSFCGVSFALRNNGLQFESYPFDWLLNFSPILFAKYLKNNFTTYFLKENLVFDSEKTPTDNIAWSVYKDKTNNVEYLHFFEKQLSFDKNYEILKKKFNKRIDRLLKRIKEAGKILLIYASKNPEEYDKILESFNEIEKIVGSKIDFIFIKLNTVIKSGIINNTTNGNIRTLDMFFDEDKNMQSSQKEWKELLDKYKISGNFYNKIKDFIFKKIYKPIKRTLINITCIFVFSKEKRHLLRKKNKIFNE